MRNCYPLISEEERLRLQAGFALSETSKALKGMGSIKALGPDGYPALFFKRTWGLTGLPLHHFTDDLLNGEEVPLEAAEAL